MTWDWDIDVAGADVRNMPLMTEEEQFDCFVRFCRDAQERHALREPYRIEADRCYDALKRSGRPRTALPLLGPWAPPSGRWERRTFMLATPDRRPIEMGDR